MAKKQDSPCMFCGGLPCRCEGSGQTKKRSKVSAKKASSRAPKNTAPYSTTLPSVDIVSERTEDVFGKIPEPKKSKFKSGTESQRQERNLSYESALRNIRELLCPKDQKKVDKELQQQYPQELDMKIEAWRRRNADESSP